MISICIKYGKRWYVCRSHCCHPDEPNSLCENCSSSGNSQVTLQLAQVAAKKSIGGLYHAAHAYISLLVPYLVALKPSFSNYYRCAVCGILHWKYSGLHCVPSVLIVLSTTKCAGEFFEIQRMRTRVYQNSSYSTGH